MLHAVLTIAAALGGAGSSALPDDWPQIGGPAHDGVSRETGWSAKGADKPLWRTQVGIGYSSFAVRGKRVYTLGFDTEAEVDVVYCFDADTGAEVWTQAYAAKIWDLYHGGGTLTTPAVDGDFVYCSEREGQLRCLRAADGEVVWEQKPAPKEFECDTPQWGFSASPFVLGERVILNYGRVVAFDKAKGTPVWKSKKNYGHGYSTPVDFQRGGKPALAVFAGSGLAILSPEDGSELAFTPWETRYQVNAMTPVVFDQRVFISSGYERGCALVDVTGPAKVLWENKGMRNHMSGALPWDGCLYGFDEKVLKCIDLEGKERWDQRGLGQGALALADGRLIVMSEEGELIVAKATPESFQELSRTKVFDGGTCWTVPVLADGRIYVRNHAGEVAALDHRSR